MRLDAVVTVLRDVAEHLNDETELAEPEPEERQFSPEILAAHLLQAAIQEGYQMGYTAARAQWELEVAKLKQAAQAAAGGQASLDMVNGGTP